MSATTPATVTPILLTINPMGVRICAKNGLALPAAIALEIGSFVSFRLIILPNDCPLSVLALT